MLITTSGQCSVWKLVFTVFKHWSVCYDQSWDWRLTLLNFIVYSFFFFFLEVSSL